MSEWNTRTELRALVGCKEQAGRFRTTLVSEPVRLGCWRLARLLPFRSAEPLLTPLLTQGGSPLTIQGMVAR